MQEILKNKKETFLLQNEEASAEYCQAKLDQLSTALLESISAGIFSVPGGHKLYLETKERIERDYWQVPRKGVKVRKKGSMGILQIKIKEGGGGSPENLRGKHKLYVIREQGDVMTDLAFKVHICPFFLSRVEMFKHEYAFLKPTRDGREVINFFIQQHDIQCAKCCQLTN